MKDAQNEMKRNNAMRLITYVLLIVLTFVCSSLGESVLDQVQTTIGGEISVDDLLNWQQEVTVGVTGRLVGIEIYNRTDNPGNSMEFFVNVGAGWQTDPHDFETIVTLTPWDEWYYIDVSSANIIMNAGEKFAIGVAHGENYDAEGNPMEVRLGISGGELYSGGGLKLNHYVIMDPDEYNDYGEIYGYDLSFRTYVDTLPSVTGGGWIDSPAGAYAAVPALTGKANFGFASKYKKGASVPTGNTEVVFKAADLNFHSSSYDWLVVTGADCARFKGTGTINGSGPFKFMIWAGDGGKNDYDTFQIKIWEENEATDEETVIYENEKDQPIGGGSIVIHAK